MKVADASCHTIIMMGDLVNTSMHAALLFIVAREAALGRAGCEYAAQLRSEECESTSVEILAIVVVVILISCMVC